jgi:hypothetical protein
LLVVVWFIQQMERLFISSNHSLLRTLKILSPNTSIQNRKFQTPGAPMTVVMRPEKGDNVLVSKDQTKYHSRVGMLLYLVKHSRPDISNAVREPTKVIDGATNAHWKSLIVTIRFVLDTRLYALKLSYFTKMVHFSFMVILIVNLLVTDIHARVFWFYYIPVWCSYILEIQSNS